MRLMSIKERKGITCVVCGKPAKYETKYKGRQMFMCNMCVLYLSIDGVVE